MRVLFLTNENTTLEALNPQQVYDERRKYIQVRDIRTNRAFLIWAGFIKMSFRETTEHKTKCNNCGKWVDCRNMAGIHEHCGGRCTVKKAGVIECITQGVFDRVDAKRICVNCNRQIKNHDKYTRLELVYGQTVYQHINCKNPTSYNKNF